MEEATFSNQENLPRLPLPKLRDTLRRYLESAKPLLTNDEYRRTETVVRAFQKEEGPTLQKYLQEKATKERNWVAAWWDERAYLRLRSPTFPYINFGGHTPSDVMPACPGTQHYRAALCVYFGIEYWSKIRKETVPIFKIRGVPWCMNQLSRMYNCCKIPGETEDRLDFHFRTEAQGGDCSSSIIVGVRGHLWRLETMDEKGVRYNPVELQGALEQIAHKSQHPQPNINCLTAADRTVWAKNRQHLMRLSPTNRDNVETIEKAAFCLTLTDDILNGYSEMLQYAIAGDCANQYADKSITYQVSKNGVITSSCDHANVDAIVVLQLFEYGTVQGNKLVKSEKSFTAVKTPPYHELCFVLDDHLKQSIDHAKKYSAAITSNCELAFVTFSDYGHTYLKSMKMYSDTIVQMALQLAYFRIHGRPVATYETASARKFYHGRTETVRSCTTETLLWCRTMDDANKTLSERKGAFLQAVKKHDKLMAEAMNGQGIDRHLFGLRAAADELGMTEPTLYRDAAWKATGGDGNYQISSSFLGYTDTFGGVVAMCDDGYGAFYKINNDSISFTVAAYKSSSHTNLQLWRDMLPKCLADIRRLLSVTDSRI